MSYFVLVSRLGKPECWPAESGNSWTFWPFKLTVLDHIERDRPAVFEAITECYPGANTIDFSELDAESFRYVHSIIVVNRDKEGNDMPFWNAIITHMENDPRF